MILHVFSAEGWQGWGLDQKPLIRDKMPVLLDDDLVLEDADGLRPAAVMNRWLRELPISGAPAPKTWLTYAQVLKSWCDFLEGRGVSPVAGREELREALSLYAEHRLSGPPQARLAASSWNLAVKTLAAFYAWAQSEGYVEAVPFSFAPQMVIRPDGARVEQSRNLAAVRAGNAHSSRSYLEPPFAELLLHALAGNDPSGNRDSFRGYETGRNRAVIGLALSTGLRAQEFTYLTVYEVPPLPARRSAVPIPLRLAPPTTKGGKGRSTWIGHEALAVVHDYISWDRAAALTGSKWRPARPLVIENPTYDGARINGVQRRWHTLGPDERRRLVAPGGGSALLGVKSGGGPFVDWAGVLRRTGERIRQRWERRFPHVHPHITRHTFAMATLERLVRGYYQQAAKLEIDAGGDDALALYLTKADPLLVLRDLLGHSNASTTQAYLHLLDTQRVYRDAYETASAVRPADSGAL